MDRRRQADAAGLRRQRGEPRHGQRQQVAALVRHQGVLLVDDQAAQPAEQARRVGIGQQQRQGFRRRHQDVRRPPALAGALGVGRVAGPGLAAYVERHLAHRRLQVARDIDGERLERRDIERMQAAEVALQAAAARQIDQAGQEAGQRLAGPGRRDQQRVAPALHRRQHFQLMRVRRPAPAVEPGGELRRQSGSGGRVHGGWRSRRQRLPPRWRPLPRRIGVRTMRGRS